MIWEIISMSAGSLVWGVVIALLCMALFVFIITSWWKDAVFTPWSYVIGAVLFLLLSIQCTLIVGSLKVIDIVDVYEGYLTEMVNQAYASYEQVSSEESDLLVKKAIERYPLLAYYVGGGNFSGYDARHLPAAMADEMLSYMHRYIAWRLAWCLLFVIAAGIAGINTLGRRQSRHTGHTPRTAPRTAGRPHVGTRRR